MKIDGALSMAVRGSGEEAARFERIGLDGAWSFEGNHDPFVPLTLASQTTERIELGTAIAVAFARTPMMAAHIAWDLQALTGGRFVLGLGTQIRPHIENRYGMPWSKPAARMREYVGAVRAIWDCWTTGEPLDVRGEFYTHTLMAPFFSPGPLDGPAPRPSPVRPSSWARSDRHRAGRLGQHRAAATCGQSPRKSRSGTTRSVSSLAARRSSSGVGRPTKYQPFQMWVTVRSGRRAKVKGTGSGPCRRSVCSAIPSRLVTARSSSLRNGNLAPSPALNASSTRGGSTDATAIRW